jgi:6-phosphogluconate dehydrogenase
VSAKAVIASAIAEQKQAAGKAEAEPQPADAQEQQRAAVREMSKMFLTSTVQGIFQGFGQMPQVEKE